MKCIDPAGAVTGCRASVLSGSVLTPYEAVGAGPPLVVLGGAGRALLPRLAAGARVIMPEPQIEGADTPAFSAWLRDFLDALGLGAVMLLAAPRYALPALAFTMLEPARVQRAVLVCSDHRDPAAPACTIGDALAGPRTPLLLVRLDTADGIPSPISAEILAFLADGTS